MLDFEIFAKRIIDKYQKHMPNNYSEQDIAFVNKMTVHFSDICIGTLNKDYDTVFNDADKEYISEMVAKWVFHTSVNHVKDNIPQDRREIVLQKIALNVFEASKKIITEHLPKGKMTGLVEIQVFKTYEQYLKELRNNGIINSDQKEDYEKRLDKFYNYTKQGYKCWEENNYNDAVFNYEQALKIMPNHTDALNMLACSYGELNNYEKAFEFSNRAISLLVENTGSYIYDTRGCALLGLKQYNEALADINKAISIEKAPAFLVSKGEILKETDDTNGAIECFNEAIKLLPDYADALEKRGKLYWEQGNLDAAISDFRRIVDINQNDDIKEDLANIYNEKEEYKKSKKILDELIFDFPFDKNLYILRARDYIGLNNLNNAIIDLDKAINLDQNSAEAYYIRGLCNFDAGDYKSSVFDFNNAVSLDSDYADYEDIKQLTAEASSKINKSKHYERVYINETSNAISFLQQIFIKYTPDGNMLYYPGFFSDGYLITSEEQIYNYRKTYNKILITLFILLAFGAKLHLFKFFKYINININFTSVLIILAGILLINFLFNFINTKLIFKKAITVKEKIWVNNSQTMDFIKSTFIKFTGILIIIAVLFLLLNNLQASNLIGAGFGFTGIIGCMVGFLGSVYWVIKRISKFSINREKDGLKIFAYKELKNIENDENVNFTKIITNIESVLPFILSFFSESKLQYNLKVNNLRSILQKIAEYTKKIYSEDLNKEEYRDMIIHKVLSVYRINR